MKICPGTRSINIGRVEGEILPPLVSSEIKKILIISLQGIGNTLLFTPALRALGERYPQADIYGLVLTKVEMHALEQNQYIRDIIIINESRYQGLIGKLKLIWGLRKKHIDLAITAYPGGLKTAVISFLSAAKFRIGHILPRSNPFQKWCFSKCYHITLEGSPDKHDIDNNFALLSALGIEVSSLSKDMEIIISPEDIGFADRFLQEKEVEDSDLLIGFHPGSGKTQTYKRWPREYYQELISRLTKRDKVKALIFGGPDEAELVRAIMDGISPPPIAVLDTTLKQTTALIDRCHLFVTNDSGLMHIAVARKVTTIAIYGPTDPLQSAPHGEEHLVIRKNKECGPCYPFRPGHLECFKRRGEIECLKEISVEEVLRAINTKRNTHR